MPDIPFNFEFEFEYGVATRLSRLVRRVVAPNPGPFTFHGTGTYLVGQSRVAVIDPGPALPAHVDAIMQALGRQPVSHILVTHTHADHSAAAKLLQARCAAPTFGFGRHAQPTDAGAALAAGVDREFAPDFRLVDGQQIEGLDWQLQAIHTPGHCANHLCFALAQEQSLFCGDHLMAWSTSVIMPPDGNIADYLASLAKLKRRDEQTYWPTHGGSITQPKPYIDQLIAHRLRRVEQVAAALKQGHRRIPRLREKIYPDLKPELQRAAELSLLASLHYLLQQRRISVHGKADLSAEYYLSG